MSNRVRSVVVLGGGPAASTLGTLLAREGCDVAMFYRERDAPILIGESLVPGVVPILRKLGVEEEVEEYGRLKPGARFYIDEATEVTYRFDTIPDRLPGYAYNVPRRPFNRSLRERARRAGVEIIPEEVRITVDGDTDPTVGLGETGRRRLNHHDVRDPDLFVDATGRSRLLARRLNLTVSDGKRRDAALFTHFDRTRDTREGLVHTDRLDYGWCWRIPLEDRVSFGVVTDTAYLDRFGETAEEKLRGLRREVDRLRYLTEGSERLEPVLEYDNYQSTTTPLHGRNWVMVGDAAGFIDPVFSSGLYLAMNGAEQLASRLSRFGLDGLDTYAREVRSTFQDWMFVTKTFYNGSLLALLKTGQEVRDSMVGRWLNPHMRKHIGRIFTGRAAESRYSMWLLRFMTRFGLAGKDPDDYRVRSLEKNAG